MSGLSAPSPEVFQPDSSALELSPLRGYNGEGELGNKIASRYGVKPEEVLISFGASQSLYLLYGALIEPGDRILVETPDYETLEKGPTLFGAKVERFERKFSENYEVNLNHLEQALQRKTKLVILTHLHNPSGVALSEETIRQAAALVAKQGGYLLVNEIYREFLLQQKSASLLAPNVISISSLTKAYGLGALRVGWIMGNAEMIQQAKHFADYLNVNLPSPSIRIASQFFDRIQPAEQRILNIEKEQGSIFRKWLEREARVECARPAAGIIGFPRMKGIQDTFHFSQFLREKFEVSVVPGEFFAAPGHLRIGFGGDPNMVQEGLERISKALANAPTD